MKTNPPVRTLTRRVSEGRRRSTARHSALRTPRSALASRRPFLERLEERTVMSSFAASFGGAADDKLYPAASDPEGNSYVPGFFSSQPADFDPGAGVLNLYSAGGSDAFVAKYGPDGAVAWARSFGGAGSEQARRTEFSREVDGDYLYVAGTFNGSVDFGPGVGVYNSAGGTDTFILKLNAATGATIWSRQLGGVGSDIASDLAAADGELTIVGTFNGSGAIDFDPGPGAALMTDANGSSFVWTLDTAGNYVSSWQVGAYVASVIVESDDIYLRGQFSGTADFDPGAGVQSRTSVGNNNFWVAKYSAAGDFGWLQTMEISVLTSGTMAADDSSLYVATTDNFQSTNADAIVASFNKADGSLRWSKRLGTSTGSEWASSCFINPDTNTLYVGGNFFAPSFDTNPSAPGGEIYSAGGTDAYVLKLDAQTGDYQQVWQIGGPGTEDYARVHDVRGTQIFVSSAFTGATTFPSGQTLTSNGGYDGYLLVIDETDALPPAPPSTKFYVADDGNTNKTFEYAATGSAIENYNLNSGNTTPRGAASTAAGDKIWVADANKKVYVYNTSGGLLGSWTAGSLPNNANVQGITTNGTDVWIVDAQGDKVYRYTNAASRLSGSQNAASSFNLNNGNKDATDLVTDGSSIWVLNNTSTDKIFKYTISGSLLGSWTISSAGGSPTGLTIDPSSVSSIWIVDSSTDRIYEFTAATSRTSGSASPNSSFALATTNTNPQGLADPPVSKSAMPNLQSAISSSHDSALLALTAELDDLLAFSKKRK
jgi:hypothetical protein